MNAIEKYLQCYAEPESADLEAFPAGFSRTLVIPAYRESADILQRLSALCRQQPGTLVILVLNRPDSDHSATLWREAFDTALALLPVRWCGLHSPLKLHQQPAGEALLIVDRCSVPIPAASGVGLARKIGNDIASQLIHLGKVQSPWIANTDADARLPAGYFSAQDKADNRAAALIYPFRHIFVDDCPKLPTLLYEYSLHYYVAGLSWAGSNYAYHTIGSTLTVNYRHYCQVRGFPKRPAAEDFYLLNKLRKTGAITSLQTPVIELEARHSSRVPFGTGPAVSAIALLNDALQWPLYHPDSFVYLRCFLQLLELLAARQVTLAQACEQLQMAPLSAPLLCQLAEALNLDRAVSHCYRVGDSADKRRRSLQEWFDGFRTLKFVHLLRDRSLGSVNFRQLNSEHKAHPVTVSSAIMSAAVLTITTLSACP